ncbi:MAG: glycosyltransferase [Alphaproteobacteria bacterium]|nr:glycosyltransferase [Alphaproteobacteria bacterium]
MLRQLRSLGADRVLIPLEDENSGALLPLLSALAAVCDAQVLEVVDPNLQRRRLRRTAALGSLLQSGLASGAGAIAVVRCWWELGHILRRDRQEAAAADGEVVYLKTNLWFGIKAGGSVGHVSGVINAILRRGLGVEVLAVERPVMIHDAATYKPVAPPSVYGVPSEVNLYRFQRSFHQQASRILKTHRPSFIYQRLSIGNYVGVQLARAFGVPLVIEYNGSEVWVQKNWGISLKLGALALRAEEACLRHAHVVVTISDVLRNELVERGVEPRRIACYPNCIEPEIFDPERFSVDEISALRRGYGIAGDAKVITFIGTFGMWHGVDVFARSIVELVHSHRDLLERTKAHFLLIGDGQKLPEVQKILSAEGVDRVVTLTGLVPQHLAPLHLAASDVFVSPHVANADGSQFFGSPTKLFEYMAMARPIIASDLEQIGQIFAGSPQVSELKSGGDLPADAVALMAKPGSVPDLVRGITLLLENPDWGAILGKASRNEALTKYTWDDHIALIFDTLREVTSPKPEAKRD